MTTSSYCIIAVLVSTLVILGQSTTTQYLDQIVHPYPNVPYFEAPENTETTSNVISYVVSTKGYTEEKQEGAFEPPYVRGRVFLGMGLFAGDPVVWTNDTVDGNWMNLKKAVQVDPCKGVQAAKSKAWLLLDSYNLTLTADIAVASEPLRILSPDTPIHGDAYNCFHVEIDGAPGQCDQFFQFDFSPNAPAAPVGYSWGFTIQSDNNNPLPFTSAIIAAGPSCPSTPGNEDNWATIALDPRTPGNSPTKITLTSLNIGTHFMKWWIQLKVPENAPLGATPFSITARYEVVPVPQAPPPVQQQPPTSTGPGSHGPESSPAARVKKPIPVWAIAIICVGCALLAAGALFWAWRLTREKPSSNSYEIY